MFSMVVIVSVHDFSVLAFSLSVSKDLWRFLPLYPRLCSPTKVCFSQFSFLSLSSSTKPFSLSSVLRQTSFSDCFPLFYFSDWTPIILPLNSPSISLKHSPCMSGPDCWSRSTNNSRHSGSLYNQHQQFFISLSKLSFTTRFGKKDHASSTSHF